VSQCWARPIPDWSTGPTTDALHPLSRGGPMISLARYRTLLGEPHMAGAFAASVVGRLPIGMAVLSLLLFIQRNEQSFSTAGIAAALYVIGIGVAAPLVGRLIDRLGPRPLLLAGAIAYPLALAALVIAIERGADPAWVGTAAFV